MIHFEKYQLRNGLRLLFNIDRNTPLVAFNLMYNVGSKYEQENKTGLAHLFEHLMFLGTNNIKDFDYYTQLAGGENNAFTNNDVTDFYITIPKANIETAFWLESDRMSNLTLTKKKFSTEKNVVIEEFKETTLNVPYGDMWHLLSEMSYKDHPYRWPTIGKSIDDINTITLNDALDFYNNFYSPSNAVLAITGDIEVDKMIELSEKWFGGINKSLSHNERFILPKEPVQEKFVEQVIKSNVPSNAIYLAFHIAGRMENEYYSHEIISDLLGRGRSARLYQKLVKDQEIFSEVTAYLSGNSDPGLLVVEGLISENVEVERAEKSLFYELDLLQNSKVDDQELEKIKNKMENQLAFEEANIMNKAINLCQFEILGNVDMINDQIEMYRNVTPEMILEQSQTIFNMQNCSKLLYLKN
jgi:predicted Zn-dependent peptidase